MSRRVHHGDVAGVGWGYLFRLSEFKVKHYIPIYGTKFARVCESLSLLRVGVSVAALFCGGGAVFDGLKKLSIAVEVLAWVGVAAGVYVIVITLGERDPVPGFAIGGGAIGGGLMLALMSHVARAVGFIADVVLQERNALPLAEGAKAPGWLVEVYHGHELRHVGGGRYWAVDRVFSSRSAAEGHARAHRK